MEILRIPSSYRMQLEYCSDNDRSYIIMELMRLADGTDIELENSMRGGIVASIWREASQLEKKAQKGKWEECIIAEATFAPVKDSEVVPLRVTPKGIPTGWPPNQTKSSQDKPNQINPSQDKEMGKDKAIIPISFTWDEELKLKLQEFLIFRKEKKCPILPSSQVLFTKKLEKMSGWDTKTAIKILEESIANWWQGIFPLDEKKKETQRVIRIWY